MARRKRHWFGALATLTMVIGLPPAQAEDVTTIIQFGFAGVDTARAVAVGPDGNTLLAGSVSGTLSGQVGAGGSDAYVRALDPFGCAVWSRQFGAAGDDEAHDISLDAAGNIYVVGQASGAFPGQTPLGADDAFIRKYGPAGNEVWTRQFGTTSTDIALGVAVDPSGTVYVAGRTEGMLTGDPPVGDSDAFVRKYDPAGNEVWTEQFGTTGFDLAAAASFGSDLVLVGGSVTGALPGETDSGDRDAFARLYDTEGNEIWTVQFGSSLDDITNAVALGPTRIAVAGEANGYILVPGEGGIGSYDAFVRLYDYLGNLDHSEVFGTVGADRALDVIFDGSDVLVGGEVSGSLFGLQPHLGGEDAFMQRFGASLDMVTTMQFGGPSDERVEAIALEGGSLLAAGRTFSAMPGNTSGGGEDAYVARIGPPATPTSAEVPNRKIKETDKTKKMSFPVALCRETPTALTLGFSAGKGTAKPVKDFKPKAGTIAFAPGQSGAKVTLKVKGDDLEEKTEKFTLKIKDATGSILGTAIGKIKDND